jgi:hypothetical protein
MQPMPGDGGTAHSSCLASVARRNDKEPRGIEGVVQVRVSRNVLT